MNKKQVIYGILALVFIISILPWLKEGIPVTDDYRHHAMRFWFIQEQFKQGYSEWMPYMYGGWPFFHFYHPMFYILTLPISVLLNPIAALKAATMLAYAIALFGTFFAGKLLFKDDEIALIASVAYFMSSHLLFHATVSGALPRLMAIALTPLTICFFIKALEENDKKYIITSGILLAVLLMMHTSIAVPAFIICFICLIYELIATKDLKKLKVIFSFLIAIGLAAAWFVPMLFEKDYGNFPGSSELGAPYLQQSSRIFGIIHNGQHYVRSNYFGYSVIVLTLIGLVMIKKNKMLNLIKIGFLASVILYFNATGLLSKIPLITTALTGSTGYFIAPLVFNAVILAGAASKAIAKKLKNNYLLYAILLIIVIDLYPGLNAFSYSWVNQPTENFVNPPALIDAWGFIKAQEGNFMVFSSVGQAGELYHNKFEFGFDWIGCPQCVQKKTYDIHNAIWQNFTKGIKNDEELGYFGVKYYVVPCQVKLSNKLAYSNNEFCVYENEQFRSLIESDKAKISNVTYGLDRISFTSESSEESSILIKTNYFKPHWHAYVNGKETEIKEVWPDFMAIDVPARENAISLEYKTNMLHIVSWFITFLTMILGVYCVRK